MCNVHTGGPTAASTDRLNEPLHVCRSTFEICCNNSFWLQIFQELLNVNRVSTLISIYVFICLQKY